MGGGGKIQVFESDTELKYMNTGRGGAETVGGRESVGHFENSIAGGNTFEVEDIV